MRPTQHVIISGGVTAAFSIWVQSWPALAACFLSGIFIDLDHHLDYLIGRKRIPLSYKKLVAFCSNHDRSNVYLISHSYELHAALWASIFIFDLNIVWLGVAVGVTTHLLCDQIANPVKPWTYFLSVRMARGFNGKKLFKEGRELL